jgi:hypothetical protein
MRHHKKAAPDIASAAFLISGTFLINTFRIYFLDTRANAFVPPLLIHLAGI